MRYVISIPQSLGSHKTMLHKKANLDKSLVSDQGTRLSIYLHSAISCIIIVFCFT